MEEQIGEAQGGAQFKVRQQMQTVMNEKLVLIARRYAGHPEFIGIDIVDVNQPGAVDDTLLHVAARMGKIEEISELLDCGANPNQAGDLGNTPLHQAAMMGKAEAVRLLLKAGANPLIKNEFDQTVVDVARLGRKTEVLSLLKGHRGQV